MHIDQLALAKSSIKKKTHFICLRMCHTADFVQVWPENDTHDWPSDKVVTQQTMAKCGKNNDSPCQRTLSHCGLWPNVVQIVPLIGGLCHAVDFDQIWSKLCSSSEDFVMQRTLTICGPNCSPHWRTLSRSGLWSNEAQIVPLVGGLCHAADFDQMWSKMCPSLEDFVSLQTSTKCGPSICTLSEDFVTQRTSTKCGPNMCPLMDDFVLLLSLTTYGSAMYSSSKKASTKQLDSNPESTQNYNCRLQLCCHVIKMLRGIQANKPQQRNDGSCIHHTTNDKWRGLHTTVTDTSLYSMREESILIVFTWTSWRFLCAYAGLLVDATMIALFACRRLKQNGNGRANANNNKPWPKNLIVSDYGRIRYYNQILLKIGCTPITNVISNTYCTLSVIPYWELTHQANPNIHRTPR